MFKFIQCFKYFLFSILLTSLIIILFSRMFTKESIPAIIALAIGIISLVIAIKGESKPITSSISIILSAIAGGLAISAIYTMESHKNEIILNNLIKDITISFIVSIIIFIFLSIIFNIKIIKKHYKLFSILLLIILFVTTLTLWLVYKNNYLMLIFFYTLILYSFAVIQMIDIKKIKNTQNFDNDEHTLKYMMAFSAAIAYFIIAIIVLIIVSGELELDFPSGGGKRSKKSKLK